MLSIVEFNETLKSSHRNVDTSQLVLRDSKAPHEGSVIMALFEKKATTTKTNKTNKENKKKKEKISPFLK